MRVLLLAALAVVCCGGAFAQAPPIKMGLWEKTMVTDTGDGKPMTMKSKSCITPAQWQADMAEATKQREGCSIQNTKTANGFTFSGTCKYGDTSLVMKGSATYTDAEHIVDESHSVSTTKGQTRKIEIKSSSRWLGANCGKIQPGDPEIE